MRVAPLASGVLALALLSACGDDDSESTAPASTEPEVTVSSPTSKPPPPSTLPDPTTSPATEPPTTSPATTPSPSTAPTPPSSEPAPSPTTAPGSLPDSVQPRVDAAIADLAGRRGVDPAAIAVVDAREVTWSDSSLGCPEPGMSYMQVLTSGFLLVLEVDGVQYEYHGGTTGDLFFCERPRPPSSGVGSS